MLFKEAFLFILSVHIGKIFWKKWLHYWKCHYHDI